MEIPVSLAHFFALHRLVGMIEIRKLVVARVEPQHRGEEQQRPDAQGRRRTAARLALKQDFTHVASDSRQTGGGKSIESSCEGRARLSRIAAGSGSQRT